MPASGVVQTPSLTELTARMPLCEIGGSRLDWVFCQYTEERTGITPGRALLQAGGNAIDVAGPVTLGRFAAMNLKPYSRVKITVEGATDFLGMLKRRQDCGQADQVVWEAWDYRWLLAKIPILGCLVWDPEEDKVKLLTRYVDRVNPNGYRNCIVKQIPNYGVAPVFSWQAEAMDREQAAEIQDASLADDGFVRAWTPRLHLLYLCCLANLQRGAVEGSDIPAWRSLYAASSLEWKADSINFAAGGDMDHVMPDTTFRGQKILHAIGETLRHTNTYGLKIAYEGDVCKVAFYVKDSSSPAKRDLPLQRGGDANDINTIHDFDLDEDSGETAEAVVTLGAANHIEGRAVFARDSSDTLVPAWSGWDTPDDKSKEDYAARKLLWGNDKGQAQGDYCKVPQDVTKLDGAWVTMDGSDGSHPPIKPGTPQAIALMRQTFPRFMRAFKLDGEQLYQGGLLKGSDSRFTQVSQFPYLKMPRPVFRTQLTYILDANGHKTKERWPIRVEVTDAQAGGGNWHDVTAESGLEAKDDNYIYLPGLTDENSAATDLLYQGSMFIPWDMALKGVRLNLAVPTDHRVMGYAEAPGDVDDAIAGELGGPIEDLIDSPGAWRFEDRVNSTPIASPTSARGTGTETYPVSGPLLDETPDAQKHAEQRLALSKRRTQRTSWRMIGIRTDIHAGDFIGKIQCSGGSGDSDYELNAPLDIVTRDYMRQETVAGNTPEHGVVSTAHERRTADERRSQRMNADNGYNSSEPKWGPQRARENSGEGRATSGESDSQAPAAGASEAAGRASYAGEPLPYGGRDFGEQRHYTGRDWSPGAAEERELAESEQKRDAAGAPAPEIQMPEATAPQSQIPNPKSQIETPGAGAAEPQATPVDRGAEALLAAEAYNHQARAEAKRRLASGEPIDPEERLKLEQRARQSWVAAAARKNDE